MFLTGSQININNIEPTSDYIVIHNILDKSGRTAVNFLKHIYHNTLINKDRAF